MRNYAVIAIAVLLSAILLSRVIGITQRADAGAGLATSDLTGALTPDDLANDLVGGGLTISNVVYTGSDIAAGTFSGGTGIIGFESGVVLGSGGIGDVPGPNVSDGTTTNNPTAGDADLDALTSSSTFDAAVLEFDFVPLSTQVEFQYVFASEEYNEYVHSSFNDVFAFFINGVNCATVNGDPVSINAINNGNPFNTDPRENPSLYLNNDPSDGGGSIDTEMDGLTVVLTCQAAVTANQTNHVKLAIADADDSSLDSNVFLETASFVALPTETSTATVTDTPQPTATDTPQPTATDTATPQPTVADTATAQAATGTPVPTATATPQTPTAATATSTPEPTPDATPTNEPTPTQIAASPPASLPGPSSGAQDAGLPSTGIALPGKHAESSWLLLFGSMLVLLGLVVLFGGATYGFASRRDRAG
ncbi:MAG: choice-of-anchor L domain-containing protein [Dehalococcoidia bacterium]